MPKHKYKNYNLRTAAGRELLRSDVLLLVNKGETSNRTISTICEVSMDQGRRALNQLIAAEVITYEGEARFTTYHPVT